MKQNRYVYTNIETNEEYTCYNDIAMEFEVGKGVVAGRFYRAAQKGKNQITLNGTTIKRTRIIEGIPNEDDIIYKRYHRNNVDIWVPAHD